MLVKGGPDVNIYTTPWYYIFQNKIANLTMIVG